MCLCVCVVQCICYFFIFCYLTKHLAKMYWLLFLIQCKKELVILLLEVLLWLGSGVHISSKVKDLIFNIPFFQLNSPERLYPSISLRIDKIFKKLRWTRKWQRTPVFLPGESQGQRSLVGYSPWGHKESYMTEQLILLLKKLKPIVKSAKFLLGLQGTVPIYLS